MEQAQEHVLEIIFTAIVFMLAFSFAVVCFADGSKYNSALTNEISRKASSQYSLAYGESYLYISPSEVYTDIMAETSIIPIYVEGHMLNSDTVFKAQSGNAASISAIKAVLNKSKYRKIPSYDINGELVSINYVGV